MMFAMVLLAVVAGALAQRLAGLGFGLMVAPFLVVLLGPFDGVLIVNLCGVTSSLLILSRVWRYVEWRRYAGLAASALVGVGPGAWLASHAPAAVLELCIGVLLIIALVSQQLHRRSWRATGPAPAVTLGFSSGLMNAAAGVGGPAMTAYAICTRWDQKGFGATLQPYFVTTGLASRRGICSRAGSARKWFAASSSSLPTRARPRRLPRAPGNSHSGRRR